MCGLSVKLPLRANLFGKFDSLSGVHSRNENELRGLYRPHQVGLGLAMLLG